MVTITERAAAEVRKFVLQHGGARLAGHGLRLRVVGGGCDGLRHELELDGSATADDTIFTAQGIRIVVDRVSLPFCDGAVIDYVETDEGAGFTVTAPGAAGPCGCGAPLRG